MIVRHRIGRLRNGLVSIALVLTVIGLVFIYSASCVYAAEKFGSSYYFLKKQVLFLVPSLIGLYLAAYLPLAWWRRFAPLLFLGSLVLMAAAFIPGLSLQVHGAKRWVSLAGMSIQPSEVLKFTLFTYLGLIFERKHKHITSLTQSYVPFLAILGLCSALLFKQPDFGSVVTIFLTAIMLFFVAEFQLKHLLVTLGFALPLGMVAIIFKAYRLRRVLIFLNPWSDPQGSGYQIIQSLIAIGSGGLWGLGIANSKQKFFYLPMQHTDFIFAIIAEETGFVGAGILIALFCAFCVLGIRIAARLTSPFAFFTTLSFVLLITLQATINLMVASGLVPTKGLGLPFVSYGGTALIVHFAMLGLISNFVRHQK